jgi:primosomal protein N' (replication factor Y) (superfamily II helicase)
LSILFIFPKRGLFQLTKCQDCGHIFECQNCSAKLVAYRQFGTKLELLCHQCQTQYIFPSNCPKCRSNKILSKFGGVEELAEILEKDFQKSPIRLDKIKSFRLMQKYFEVNFEKKVFVTTRIYDPAIKYTFFEKIIFLQAENLLASPDYLVSEDINKSLSEIFLQIEPKTQVIFDTVSPELNFFVDLLKLHYQNKSRQKVQEWFLNLLEQEKENRQTFMFPPFWNLLLLTTQEKTYQESLKKLEITHSYLQKLKLELPKIVFSKPYQAKFLKRRKLFSHHILVKYPREYADFEKLQRQILNLSEIYKLQVRLNPRHLF